MKNFFKIFGLMMVFTKIINAQGGVPCPGTPSVDYAGKTYLTVLIDGQCWLKENLNVGTRINGEFEQTNNGIIEKYCYNDSPDSCDRWGGLYQWNEAMQYDTTEPAHGICPSGWHLPTYWEYKNFETIFLGDYNALKAIGQGRDGGEGTNTSGFSGLLAGCRSTGIFSVMGAYSFFVSSTQWWGDNRNMLSFILPDYYNGVSYGADAKWAGYSVRCVMDETTVPIQLGSFNAIPNPLGNGVKLEWQTISEINNYGFYIERKSEGEQNFREIQNSFIAGHGTTLEMHEYSFVDNTLTMPGVYQYRLRQVDNDGIINYSHVVSINTSSLSVAETAPIEFRVYQNYPNPFNPSTEITYSLTNSCNVVLKVYDVLGNEVTTLVNRVEEPGYKSVSFDASKIQSGVYFYRLQAGTFVQTNKMLLMK